MLIRRAELAAGGVRDVRVVSGMIRAIAPTLDPAPGETVVDAGEAALLPGLHDHHIHLLALAAARRSVICGPPEVESADALGHALRSAAQRPDPDPWLRGVAYHESVAGPLDRHALDTWVADRPVRIQHRSGAMWLLNGRACERLGLAHADHPGIERDVAGHPTGRLHRADDWLRERLGPTELPRLESLGGELGRYGVTGVTDATPHNDASSLATFENAVRDGSLPQRLVVMGTLTLPEPDDPRLVRGAHKILLDERRLPALDALRDRVRAAHAQERPVAIHAVTRAELWLAIVALEGAGIRDGDRIEHASIAPPEARDALAKQGVTVVTQPNFVHERGDAYLRDVDAADQPYLYCGQGFLAAGVALGGGTDAPFGDPDPWRAMRAAVERQTRSGAALGPEEALAPERALALFTSHPRAPGGAPRTLAPGAPADLCLLDRPWREARTELSARRVRATFVAGRPLGPLD